MNLPITVKMEMKSVPIENINTVLLNAYHAGVIDSWLLHELDDRLKYNPERPWDKGITNIYGKFTIDKDFFK